MGEPSPLLFQPFADEPARPREHMYLQIVGTDDRHPCRFVADGLGQRAEWSVEVETDDPMQWFRDPDPFWVRIVITPGVEFTGQVWASTASGPGSFLGPIRVRLDGHGKIEAERRG